VNSHERRRYGIPLHRKRPRVSDHDAWLAHCDEVEGDEEKEEVLREIGIRRGWLTEDGRLIDPANPPTAHDYLNDRIRDSARPSARIERLTRRARGEPES
jgi:hypothetical protein